MHCPYKKNDYCSYRDKQCTPNALSCYLNHKQQNYASTSPHKTETLVIHKKENSDVFPSSFDVEVKVLYRPVILIYGGVLSIKKKKLKDYKIIVNDILDSNRKYSLYVICNVKNNFFYMGDKVLKYYMKKNYHPDVIFRYAKSSECTEPISSIDMSEISVLKMYGYTVGKSGLPKQQRQDILGYILDNKIMRGHEIINLLQFNIAMREHESRYYRAIHDWQEDIGFVAHYFD